MVQRLSNETTLLRPHPVLPVGPSGRTSGLWLDAVDALQQLSDRARNDVFLRRIGHDLITAGFTIVSGLQDVTLIAQARKDYDHCTLQTYPEQAGTNRDNAGRQFRLANFHLYSDAAMKLAKNQKIMRLLDFVFGKEAAIHTSLTFQYSTMQELHRDAPYFHTFPESCFVCGRRCRTYIRIPGPLSYIPGSHRLAIDQWTLYNEALTKTEDRQLARREALHKYQHSISEMGKSFAPREYALLNSGDIAIWHPQLIHGGSTANNAALKRHSMVVHCCPADTFVYVDDVFLMHHEDKPPAPYYEYAQSHGRKHGNFFIPGFMNSI